MSEQTYWGKRFEESWLAYLHEGGLNREEVGDREEDASNGYKQGLKDMLEKVRVIVNAGITDSDSQEEEDAYWSMDSQLDQLAKEASDE